MQVYYSGPCHSEWSHPLTADSDSLERKLAAILSADAVGYSRLMSDDDEATVRTVRAHQAAIERIVATFRGRVVDTPGDNLLAEFPSAVGSVRCALEIQRALAVENKQLAPERRMLFRIGIHLGDVVVEQARVYGDGVNIAARLEGLAEPGGICLSDLVYQQVRRRLELDATDLGEQELKNIDGAVRAYGIGPVALSGERPLARAATRVELTPPDKPSLAVLPFVNMSGDPAQEYFGDGLTDDIMTELARLPGLFLIAHGSMVTYKGTGATPAAVARELGVRHVLEGGVRQANGRVRVTARLIEAESGRHVWAERYDRDLEDLFDVQDEIMNEIVTELDVALVSGEDARICRNQLRHPQALGVSYKGVDLLQRMTKEDTREARHLFEQVIQLAPDSPTGYSHAAWTHYFEVERGWSDAPEKSLEKMSALANRALELEDTSGYSHLMLGHMHLMKREYNEALAVSERGLDERPSCQAANGLHANILNYCARPKEAIPLAQKAIRLTPVAQPWFPEVLSTAHYLNGDLEEAIATAHAALALAPDSVNARVALAAVLVETERLDAARSEAREILSIDPSFSLQSFLESRPYRDAAVLTRLEKALREVDLPDSGEGLARVYALAVPGDASRRRVAPRPRRS